MLLNVYCFFLEKRDALHIWLDFCISQTEVIAWVSLSLGVKGYFAGFPRKMGGFGGGF